MKPRQRRKLAHETMVQIVAFLGGLPAVVIALALLWSGDWTAKVQWTLSVLIVAIWIGCLWAIRGRVIYPMQTLTNLLAALREGDYSLRSRRARRDDSLGEVMREVNALADTLLEGRRRATEATALLKTVMEEIDVVILAFDDERRLRLINRAGLTLLNERQPSPAGKTAEEIGLSDLLAGPAARIFPREFPGRSSSRWDLRRTSFREGGRPHQLIVLADLSRHLREEERAAWQRLIRVLGHEMNNSLAPIQSIAATFAATLRKSSERRAKDWEEDLRSGLDVIAARSEALGRFMGAYARLARLPLPVLQRCELSGLIHRAAALEANVVVRPCRDIQVQVDPDQIEQLLINLIRNAVEAGRETGGAVAVSCSLEGSQVEIRIEDEGPGLADTTNLFVPFFTTKPQGSGIGLVLCRQIAEAHGGSIALENRADGKSGCRAIVRLPVKGL
jgi:nitrogen fixation/metabolism regulation signal transduction histidine kinase